jgi:hypothetical protein
VKHRLDRENQTAFPFEEFFHLYRERAISRANEKDESL